MHKEVGYTTPDPEEAAIKALAMRQSREAFVVADYSKIAMTTFTKIAELAAATIITDNKARDYVNEWKDTTKVEVVTL